MGTARSNVVKVDILIADPILVPALLGDGSKIVHCTRHEGKGRWTEQPRCRLPSAAGDRPALGALLRLLRRRRAPRDYGFLDPRVVFAEQAEHRCGHDAGVVRRASRAGAVQQSGHEEVHSRGRRPGPWWAAWGVGHQHRRLAAAEVPGGEAAPGAFLSACEYVGVQLWRCAGQGGQYVQHQLRIAHQQPAEDDKEVL